MASPKELFQDQLAQIAKIDKVFDSLDDSATASKRKITNELIAGVQDTVKPVAEDMIAKIEAIPEEQRFAIYLGFTRMLAKKFEKDADAFVVSRVPEPTEQKDKPEISDSQRKTLMENRKSLLERAKVLGEMSVDMGEISQEDYEDMLPKRRHLSGPRGKRAISFYDLFVGDTKYESMAEVAKAHGYNKAKELTAAIRADREVNGEKIPGVNLTDPPREFSFTLKDGQVLRAVDTRQDSEREPDEDDSDDDDDED